jgi:hypothetical protein
MKIFSVDGYFVDDNSEFSSYLITEYDSIPEGYLEEDIFYYGMSEKDICINMNGSDLEISQEFKITDYDVVDDVD